MKLSYIFWLVIFWLLTGFSVMVGIRLNWFASILVAVGLTYYFKVKVKLFVFLIVISLTGIKLSFVFLPVVSVINYLMSPVIQSSGLNLLVYTLSILYLVGLIINLSTEEDVDGLLKDAKQDL